MNHHTTIRTRVGLPPKSHTREILEHIAILGLAFSAGTIVGVIGLLRT